MKEQKEHSLYLYAVEGYVQVGDIWRVLVVLEVGKKGQTKKENLAKKVLNVGFLGLELLASLHQKRLNGHLASSTFLTRQESRSIPLKKHFILCCLAIYIGSTIGGFLFTSGPPCSPLRSLLSPPPQLIVRANNRWRFAYSARMVVLGKNSLRINATRGMSQLIMKVGQLTG